MIKLEQINSPVPSNQPNNVQLLSALTNLKSFYEAELTKKKFQSAPLLSSVYLLYSFLNLSLTSDPINAIDLFPIPNVLHDHLRLIYFSRDQFPFKVLKHHLDSIPSQHHKDPLFFQFYLTEITSNLSTL